MVSHGPIEVNGQTYNGTMPPMGHLKDEEIADILSYVRTSWGNEEMPFRRRRWRRCGRRPHIDEEMHNESEAVYSDDAAVTGLLPDC